MPGHKGKFYGTISAFFLAMSNKCRPNRHNDDNEFYTVGHKNICNFNENCLAAYNVSPDLCIILEVLGVPDTLLHLLEEGEGRPAVLRDGHFCTGSPDQATAHSTDASFMIYSVRFKYINAYYLV
jgi:hypothetical protein